MRVIKRRLGIMHPELKQDENLSDDLKQDENNSG